MVAPSKSWGDKIGATGGNRSKKGDSGAGTKALTDPDILGTAPGWNQTGPGGPTITRSGKPTPDGSPGGGTSTTWQQTPGAVPNFPDANPAEELAKAAVIGPLGMAAKVAWGAVTGEDPSPFDPGQQRGWQPDRHKGKANMTGIGDPGSASGLSPGERAIPGSPYSRDAVALIGDDLAGNPYMPPSGDFSDVMMQDRRRPRDELTAEQKRRALLAA
ncbi:hypothetical protein [Dongia sp. agr-C8]